MTVALGQWAERAACRRFPADWWHSNDSRERERAADVCGECPVQRECLSYAQAWWQRREGGHTRPQGIWGGWLFRDGDRPAPVGTLRVAAPLKRLPLQPCGTAAAYKRHRKRGETPCLPCLVAGNAASAVRDRKMRARKAEAKLGGTA